MESKQSTAMRSEIESTTASETEFSICAYATGWQTALNRVPKVFLRDPLDIDFKALKTVTVRVRAQPVKVLSYLFPPIPDWNRSSHEKSVAVRKTEQLPTPSSREVARKTRIRPPRDVVKLQDRLFYLLQPPLESLFTRGSIRFPFDPFPYQFEGIAFLYPRHVAVLADEMGLGKTMQAISAIRLLLHAEEVRSVLLVCPKPLVTNWQREFHMWAPEIPLAVIEGDQTKRRWQWGNPSAPVKIANYELLVRDAELLDELALQFDLVVLDEAQRIKNRSSTTSKVVRSIARSRNWALTGTPVENSPDDLVGIFEFLSKGFLRPGMSPRQMARDVRDSILRRTKDMVLHDMPPKLFRDADLELTGEQYETYMKAEDEGVLKLNRMGGEATIQHVFELVLRLKQICNFDPVTDSSCKLDRLNADLEEVAASGQKAIVFSQWVQTLEKINSRLAPYRPLQYHGRIPSKKRDLVLQQFKEDPDCHVLLMSYGAGSVGLNLQFCRYVFLFDRWWNPAVEDQAINRAHRIGAAGSVTVTRMLAVGTIEDRINQVLEEKREMFDTIFSQTHAPRSAGLSHDEIFGLFDLTTPKGPLDRAA